MALTRWTFVSKSVSLLFNILSRFVKAFLPRSKCIFRYLCNIHVWMWELDHKEGWAPKNWCFWSVVLEKTLESILDCKEIKPVNPKGNQSWIFIGRTDAEAEYFGQYFGHLMGRTDSWKRPWCWESLKAEGEDREGDGWMLSSTQWTWVWATSGRWWRTGRPGMLQSMGSQREGHD